MQTTTISFFRFETTQAKLWAFGQMQFARGPLNRTPNVLFCKLMGSGTGESFDPKPDFGIYSVMLVWASKEAAEDGLATNPVLKRYRARAAENFNVILQAQSAWGLWDGRQPFEAGAEKTADDEMIGVLTRATLKKSSLMQFWKSVPDVSDQLKDQAGLLFKLGMGEVPWVQQVTFSIWNDAAHMRTFAYKDRAHSTAIKLAREGKWFKEDLFARFRILSTDGTWEGRPPVEAFAVT